MQEVYKIIGRVAPTDATVLIQGETGTGKELVANTIHYHSDAARTLRRHQLLGHSATSCSRASCSATSVAPSPAPSSAASASSRPRLRGTLFLDEIADMPLGLQAKVLRVLQEREFTRVGGREPIRADARIVAATNQDLEARRPHGPLPRGPLLPAERRPHRRAAAARAARPTSSS